MFGKFKFVLRDILDQLGVVLITGPSPHQSLYLVHTNGVVGVADHAYQLINSPADRGDGS